MSTVNPPRAVILAIDDDPEVLAEITRVLQSAGYACHACQTSAAAMAMARQTQPELIISDINLDGENGLDLCRRIKADNCLRDIPVMFLSGAPIPNIVRQAHAAGGTYYLRKPFDPDVLCELIEKALWMPHLVSHRIAQESGTASA